MTLFTGGILHRLHRSNPSITIHMAVPMMWFQMLEQDPLLYSISFQHLTLFVDLACHLRERIKWNQREDTSGPPVNLPISVYNFLCDAIGVEDHIIKSLWLCLRQFIWDDPSEIDNYFSCQQMAYLMPVFLKYGLPHGVGKLCLCIPLFLILTLLSSAFYDFYPPYRTCIDPECQCYHIDPDGPQGHDLTEPFTYSATLLTKDFGAVPCYCTSFYCCSEYHSLWSYLFESDLRFIQIATPGIIIITVSTCRHHYEATTPAYPYSFRPRRSA